jgi:hypothetical protein
LNRFLKFCFSPLLNQEYSFPVEYSKEEVVKRFNYAFAMTGIMNSPNLGGKFVSDAEFNAKPRWEISRTTYTGTRMAYLEGKIVETSEGIDVNITIYTSDYLKVVYYILFVLFPIFIGIAILKSVWIILVFVPLTYLLFGHFIHLTKEDLKESVQNTLYRIKIN